MTNTHFILVGDSLIDPTNIKFINIVSSTSATPILKVHLFTEGILTYGLLESQKTLVAHLLERNFLSVKDAETLIGILEEGHKNGE